MKTSAKYFGLAVGP